LAAQVSHPNSNFSSEHFHLAPHARRARLATGLAGASVTPLHIFKTAKSFSESKKDLNPSDRLSQTWARSVSGDTF
jgi:hypothetical protein